MEWLERDKSQNRTEFDGEVILQLEDYKGKKRVQFKFRKNSANKILGNDDYVVVARDGDCIYFKESDKKKGFKLSAYGVGTRIFKVLQERFPLSEKQMGEYNLEFDSRFGLHYISLRRKLEKTLSWEGK